MKNTPNICHNEILQTYKYENAWNIYLSEIRSSKNRTNVKGTCSTLLIVQKNIVFDGYLFHNNMVYILKLCSTLLALKKILN